MMNGKNIKKAIKMPNLAIVVAAEKANSLYHTRFGRYNSNPYADANILDEDWDNLILLDACRYDYFSDVSSKLPGKLSKRISPGAKTKEFIQATFKNRYEVDLVYLTTNSWWGRLAEDIDSKVFKFINLAEENIQDPELNVELPNTVVKRALEVSENYPDKRLLIHFNQPHYPFIGETGRSIFPTTNRTRLTQDIARVGATPEQVRTAYRENLEAVIPGVKKLLNELDGKTVVTADHGEMLGERGWPIPVRAYGHTAGFYMPELVEVPWLEYNNNGRKNISEEGDGTRDVNPHAVKKRLNDLGYL